MLINVLIVENESIVALDLKHILESANYKVTTAVSGEKALQIIENNKIDLIFMSTQLRGPLNGIETAVKIRNQFNIPIIYISANSNLTREELGQTRPFQYLTKPFKNSQIETAIKNCLMIIKLNEIISK